jgi:hypothetical protein
VSEPGTCGIDRRSTAETVTYPKKEEPMPNWQPKWDDVVFDHAEANEAISLCRGALIALGDRHAALQGPYQMACLNWRGVKRFRFDAEWSAMQANAEAVSEQLRVHISKLHGESEAALIEQRFREGERARWYRDKAIEDAAAAAAREAARIAAVNAAAAAAAHAANAAASAAAHAASATETKPALVFAPVAWSFSAVSLPQTLTSTVSNSAGASAAPPVATSTSTPTSSPVVPRASGQFSGR